MGRRSTYDQATANEVCSRLTEGQSLRSICQNPEMPTMGCIFSWIELQPAFAEQYAHARDVGWRVLADDLMNVADDLSIPSDHRRIMVDTRKWVLAKMLPKIYGDKLDITQRKAADIDELDTAELAAIAKGKPGA